MARGVRVPRRIPIPITFARPASTLSSSRRHGGGCPCCAPPSGAASWCTPSTASTRKARPISFGPIAAKGEAIECDALVAMAVNDLQLKRVKVAPPAPGEVRVKVSFSN